MTWPEVPRASKRELDEDEIRDRCLAFGKKVREACKGKVRRSSDVYDYGWIAERLDELDLRALLESEDGNSNP